MKPLIEIINTDNEPNIIQNIMDNETTKKTLKENHVAIKFGIFITGTMPQEAKQVQREYFPNYMEKLFELFIEKYYE